jgi:hypothetical protein
MNLNKISFALVETRPTKCTLKGRKQPENSQKNNSTKKK